MRKFWAVFYAAFWGLVHSIGFGGRKGKKKGGGMLSVSLILGLCVALSAFYGVAMAGALGSIGAIDLMFAVLSMLAVIISTVFVAMGAKEVVFGTRDMDIVLALPIHHFELIMARLAALYAETLAITLAWTLPQGVIYSFCTGFSLLVWLRLVVASALLALLPVLLALVFGFVVAFLTGRATRHALVENILYMVLLLGCLGFSFALGGAGSAGATFNSDTLYAMFSGPQVVLLWFSQFITSGSLTALGGLAVVGIVPMVALAALCSLFYGKILAGLCSHGSRSDYKLDRLQGGSLQDGLVKKELARFVNTPIYLFNTGVGLILMVIAGVASLIMGGQMDVFLAENGLQGAPILPMAAGVMGFCLALTAISGSSISLEGKSFWVLQSLPVSNQEILHAKARFHILVTAPFTALSGVLLGLGLRLGLVGIVVLAGGGLLMNWFTANAGLLINLRYPRLDAVSDMIVVKQSAAAALSMLAGAVVLLVCGVVWYLAQAVVPAAGPWAALAVLALVAAATHRLRTQKGPAMLAALSE